MSELEQKLTDCVNIIENLERLSKKAERKDIKLVQFSMNELTYPVLNHKGTKYAVKRSNGNFTISLYDEGAFSIPPGQRHDVDFNSLLKQIHQMDSNAIIEIEVDTLEEMDVRECINIEELISDKISTAESIIFLPLKKIEIGYTTDSAKNMLYIDSPNIYRPKIMKLMHNKNLSPSEPYRSYSGNYVLGFNLENPLRLCEFITLSDEIADSVDSNSLLKKIGLKTRPEKVVIDIFPPRLEMNYNNKINVSYMRSPFFPGSTEKLSIQFQKDKIGDVAKFIDGLWIKSEEKRG
jgi:hypothetical protein